ncbi:hypothetical protein K461DRAFT_291521 [Myriangium duriaei CBS 260.36]|uniref:HMG box domain-containing protein n=1 Tax=Myriangium duriaei CBS 260.36 TaxID=1168546 RepID=A0A9P4J5Q5_9PEZI|nr:hypothetical protein K461DRAFT_291521 [Myriangium duriaei CBS 260.36]
MLSARLPFRIASVARTTRQAPLLTQFVARTAISRNVIVPSLSRSYATPAKPKKGSVGATSTARKPRATKTTTKAATKKTATRTKATSATKKPRKTAARKTKTPEQKAAAKEKAAAKRLATAEKAKAKKAATAVRTKAKAEKARTKAKKIKATERITLLKAQALSPPSSGAQSGYHVFLQAKSANEKAHHKEVGPTVFFKEVAAEWKSLSSSEHESYQRRAAEKNTTHTAEYAAWVSQHTANEIRLANIARSTLRASGKKGYRAIKDPRQLPRPETPFLLFSKTVRGETGSITEDVRVAGERWRGLSQGEKDQYRQEFERNLQQYDRDFEALYGVPRKAAVAEVES